MKKILSELSMVLIVVCARKNKPWCSYKSLHVTIIKTVFIFDIFKQYLFIKFSVINVITG